MKYTLAGDINTDFYKYHNDKFNSEYLDILFDLGYMPVITKATSGHRPQCYSY
mgnify:CR=1 FL=1